MKKFLFIMAAVSSLSYAQDRPKIIVHDSQPSAEINSPASPIMRDNFEQVPFNQFAPVFSSPETVSQPVNSDHNKTPKQTVKQPSIEVVSTPAKKDTAQIPAVKQKSTIPTKENNIQERIAPSPVQAHKPAAKSVDNVASEEIIISGKRYVLSETKQDKPAESTTAPAQSQQVNQAGSTVTTTIASEKKNEQAATGQPISAPITTEPQTITVQNSAAESGVVTPTITIDHVKKDASPSSTNQHELGWATTGTILISGIILIIISIVFIIKKNRRQESYWF